MKYTNEQKRILSFCRKYKGVTIDFSDDLVKVSVNGKDCIGTLNNGNNVTYARIGDFLIANATLKSVGRPKGSTKPNRKVKKTITFTADQWSKVERIQREQGLKYASHAIGLAVEAFSKNKTAYEIQSQIGNDCCICKHVEYCPNAKWDNDKLNTCEKWQISEGGE